MLSPEPTSLPPHILGTPEAYGISLAATGDKMSFPVPFLCEVLYAGLVITATCAGATTTPIVKFDRRPTAGSDTGRGDGDLGGFALGTQAAGKTVYFKPPTRIVLEPGEEVIMQVTTAATGTGAGGSARPILVVRPRDEQFDNLAGMVLATAP